MRWALRLRLRGRRREAVAAARPARQAWRVLPRLRPTISTTPPALVPPTLPDVSGTRELVHTPAVVSRRHAPVGVVQGMARVLPIDTAPRPTSELGLPLLVPARRAVRTGRPAETPELLHAVEEYLGEPREPAEPYHAPGWLRATPPVTPEHSPDPPPRALPPAQGARLAALSPQTTIPQATESRPAAREGRPNLGHSRRLGLGVPLRRAGGNDMHPPESAPSHHTTAKAKSPVPSTPPSTPAAAAAEEGDPAGEPQPQAMSVRPPPQPAQEVARAERVPLDLSEAFRTAHGVDVSDVPVHRGTEASVQAQAIGARAFTRAGQVFLPSEAGPLSSSQARGLLGHELAHVVQQRALGAATPAESTPHGRELEAKAVAAEAWVSSGTSSPPPLIHPVARSAGTPSVVQRAASTEAPPAPSTQAAAQPQSVSTPAAGTAQVPASSQPTGPATGATSTGSARSARVMAGGVMLPDDHWKDAHDALNPRDGTELGSTLAGSFQGMVLDSWGIDDEQAQPDRDVRRTQLRHQLLETINQERARQHMTPVPELGHDELAMVDQQMESESQRGGRGPVGRGGATRNGSRPPLPGRQADPITTWAQFGSGMEQDARGLLGDFWGIDLPDDATNNQRPAPSSPSQATGRVGSGATGSTGLAAATAHPATSVAATPHGLGEHDIDVDRLDMDELAGRLYDRLRSRLRLELLVDRERAGLLADFR